MYRIASAASLLALVAVPAGSHAAVVQAAQSVEGSSTDSSDAHRIVCKKEEQIGSRLGAKRICLTIREWEDRAKADRDSTESAQRLATSRLSEDP